MIEGLNIQDFLQVFQGSGIGNMEDNLTLSPMGSNPTDLLWGGGICPPPYVKRLELKSW